MQEEICLQQINPFVRFAYEMQYIYANWEVNRDLCGCDHRLYYILGDGCEFIADNKKYNLARGALIIIPAGYQYQWVMKSNLQIISVNFDYTRVGEGHWKFYRPVEAKAFDESLMSERIRFCDAVWFNEPLVMESAPMLEAPLRELVREFSLGDLYRTELLSHMLAQVLLQVSRSHMIQTESYLPGEERINYVINYIQTHYRSAITNEDIAARFNLHPNYLNRLFKKRIGTTLHRYLTSYRIRMACELLRATDMRICDVALEVGFSDVPNFTRMFSKQVGQTPSEYAASKTMPALQPEPDMELEFCGNWKPADEV